MVRPLNRVTELFARAIDTTTAAISAVWPRSMSAREIARLSLDGHPGGSSCEIAWSLYLPDATTRDQALREARARGFSVLGTSDGPDGFVTVKTPVRLAPFAMSLAGARANRLARRHGGFAELIGPVSAPAVAAGASGRAGGVAA